MQRTRVASASLLLATLASFTWLAGEASAQLAGDLADPTGRTPYVAPAPIGPGPATAATPNANTVPEAPGGPGWAERSVHPIEPMDATLAMRLRVLDGSFQVLGSRGGPDYLGSILSLVGGAAEIVFGGVFIDLGGGIEPLGYYLVTLGSITVVRTILVDFILRPDPRGPAIEYAHMASRTHAEQIARLEYGERQLDSLADQFFIARVVDASLNLAAAVSVVPAYLAPKNFEIVDPLEAFIFIGPAISLIGAIVTLATPSPAEQRRDAYHQMRDRLEEGDESAALPPPTTFSSSFAVDPQGGGLATFGGTF